MATAPAAVRSRSRRQAGSVWARLLQAAVLAAGMYGQVVQAQVSVPIALPPGTDTAGLILPSAIVVPPAVGNLVNPLGLMPGFYSLNLGQCLGAAFGNCTGAFMTHAASIDATGGLPKDPADIMVDWVGATISSAISGDEPAAPRPTDKTMPGWSLFHVQLPNASGAPSPHFQQALSFAKQPGIEMPLAQVFGVDVDEQGWFDITADARSHYFGRSENYDRLSVGWGWSEIIPSAPPIFMAKLDLQAQTLDLGAGPSDVIVWQAFVADDSIGKMGEWRMGLAAVRPDDTSFVYGTTQPLGQASILQLMLQEIRDHVATEEPEFARQAWATFNSLSLMKHDDWEEMARRIAGDLTEVLGGKESHLLTADGALRFPIRSDIAEFILPEPLPPVPEPSTWMTLAAGLASLAWARRRRAAPGATA